jgi:hypothetical protein
MRRHRFAILMAAVAALLPSLNDGSWYKVRDRGGEHIAKYVAELPAGFEGIRRDVGDVSTGGRGWLLIPGTSIPFPVEGWVKAGATIGDRVPGP